MWRGVTTGRSAPKGGDTQAVAQLGGDTVYFDPGYVLHISVNSGAAIVTHEALHNLGLNDAQIESALDLTAAQCAGSDCITTKPDHDCLQPSLKIMVGLP